MQHGIHELAGSISRKRTSRAVRAVRPRSESHNQDSCLRVAEPGHGLAPILAGAVSPPPLARDLLAICDQARAASAGNHFTVQDGEPISHSLFSVLFRSRAHLETQTEYRISTGTTLIQR